MTKKQLLIDPNMHYLGVSCPSVSRKLLSYSHKHQMCIRSWKQIPEMPLLSPVLVLSSKNYNAHLF